MTFEVEGEKPRIIIPLVSWQKIMAYVDLCPVEITGFGDVTYDKTKNEFIIGEIYLPDQSATAGDVDVEEEDVSKFMLERMEAGATQMPRLWWHSHVEMEAFFSGTDDAQMKDFSNDTFFVGIVVNKRGEYKASIKVCEPFVFMIEELDIIIDYSYSQIPQDLKAEFEQKVKYKQFNVPSFKPKFNKNKNKDFNPKNTLLKKNIIDLPASEKEAHKVAKDLGLTRYWDSDLKLWLYYDMATGDRYQDKGEVILMDNSIPEINNWDN